MIKLTQTITEFTDIIGYKTNTQTSIAFIHTNNKRLEKGPFTIAIKNLILRNKCSKKSAKPIWGTLEIGLWKMKK